MQAACSCTTPCSIVCTDLVMFVLSAVNERNYSLLYCMSYAYDGKLTWHRLLFCHLADSLALPVCPEVMSTMLD